MFTTRCGRKDTVLGWGKVRSLRWSWHRDALHLMLTAFWVTCNFRCPGFVMHAGMGLSLLSDTFCGGRAYCCRGGDRDYLFTQRPRYCRIWRTKPQVACPRPWNWWNQPHLQCALQFCHTLQTWVRSQIGRPSLSASRFGHHNYSICSREISCWYAHLLTRAMRLLS